MGKRIAEFFRSDLGVLVLVAAAFLALHVATNGKYGFHRDELQTLDDARHLDWGFVPYPPVTPLIGRVELFLFGTSLIGFRFFAAVAVSTIMVLVGLMAKELGGNRHIQLLAAVAAGIVPMSLVQGAVFQYVSFDYLWGVTATYLLIRLLKSEDPSTSLRISARGSDAARAPQDPRWWVPIGAVLGLGMQTRYTMGVLVLGIVGAVLLTPARRFLLNRWLWVGVGISLLVFLPNLIWQVRHHFISLEWLSYLRGRDLRLGRYDGFYREQLLTCVNPVTAPLALRGLWFYFVRPAGRRYRFLGWTFVLGFVLFALARSRSYYTAPLYPMLLAAGSVQLGIWLGGLRPAWSRFAYGVQWTAIFVGGVALIPLLLPVAPIGSGVWRITSKMYDQFREEVGWPDLARSVSGVYDSLSAEERQRTGILTGNYGEAGALNLYGPELGLPHAMSLTNSFWYRGYDPRLPQTVILAGFGLDEGQKLFERCVIAAKNTNPFGVVNEESRNHPDILICRNLRMPWDVYWQSYRRFG